LPVFRAFTGHKPDADFVSLVSTTKGAVMNAESTARSRAEVADEVSKWTVGGGIITLALFPLALPILILTAIAVLPILVPLVAVGIVAGVVALPVILIRKLGRSVSRLRIGRGPRGHGQPSPEPVVRP
jgi:hypothetical protein